MNTARRGTVTALLLAASLAAQKTHEIGSVGATLKLDSSWRRQTLDKDDDADQFNGSKGSLFRRREMYATVRELQGIYENAGDYRRALDELTTVGTDTEVKVTRDAGWTRAARVIETELNGMKLVFQSELLVQPGLSYHVLTWSPRKDRRFLAQRTEELRNGFAFPPADATWRDVTRPTRHTARQGALQISFAAAPAMLSKEPNEYDEQLRLASPDGEHIVMVYAGDDGANDTWLLRQEREALVEYQGSTKELSREPFELDGAKATLMVSQSKTHATHSLLIQRHGSNLMLRYFAPGKAKDARAVRDALLASLKVEASAKPLALPDIQTGGRSEPGWSVRTREFVARGTLLTELDTWSVNSSGALAGGDIVFAEGRAVWRIAGGEATAIYRSDEYAQLQAVPYGDDALLLSDGKLWRLADGDTSGKPICDAVAATSHGDQLFVVRTRKRKPIGLETSWQTREDIRPTLLRRNADGTEQTITTLGDLRVSQLVASLDGEQVAIRSWQPSPLAPREWPQQLDIVTLADGKRRTLGAWRSCEHVAPATDGWLVTGTPVGQPAGIWLMPAHGKPRALVTGSGLHGIACTAQQLTYAVSLDNGATRVVRTSLADCASHGRTCQPFSIEALSSIGDRLIQDAPKAPRTLAEVTAMLEKADEIAQNGVGARLPADARQLEALLAAINESQSGPNGNGRRLLALLTARAFVANGCTWVDGGADVDWDSWLVRNALPQDDPFAATANPTNTVVSWLDDSEGGYSTGLQRTPDRARGVPMLAGVDNAALLAKAHSLVIPGLREAIAAGRTKQVADALASRPANDLLRERCYLALAEYERYDAIDQIAGRFSRSDDAAAVDAVAQLNVQLVRQPDAATSGKLFEQGMRAARRYPRDVRIYMTLAQLAERAFPKEPAKARQCYERVLQLEQFGKAPTQAREALERLSK